MSRGTMRTSARVSSHLLIHVNLLLTLSSGAGLATAARLKWDPSTYVVVRELVPTEYRVFAAVLCAASFALMLLAHLGGAALLTRPSPARRTMLYTFAALMSVLVMCELVFMSWALGRLLAWLHSPDAAVVYEALDLRDEIRTIMRFINRLYPLPAEINELLEEVEQDLPRNLYVAGAGVVLVALSQPLSIALACVAARGATDGAHGDAAGDRGLSRSTTDDGDIFHSDSKKPLIKYQNGRLVAL
ncbi:uncharacterized protein LOC113509721 [Galleria mellonella]|uniref:Uncharacterized protein LOC113509721 n=1 Tax=Galleria mellonella TaxID=7137 RepID=A0A6J1W7Y1_GALME|nr:uncharacterized protein LOC113509721 [Galleria mellonella]